MVTEDPVSTASFGYIYAMVITHYCISATRITKVRLPQCASFGAFATEVAMYVSLYFRTVHVVIFII
jgi:hypothetical protein